VLTREKKNKKKRKALKAGMPYRTLQIKKTIKAKSYKRLKLRVRKLEIKNTCKPKIEGVCWTAKTKKGRKDLLDAGSIDEA